MNPLDAAADTGLAPEEVRARLGRVEPLVQGKRLRALDKHCRSFIELSPFVCLGTAGPDGSVDVSPRGDPPGFVRILDDRTLAIPERPGNRLADSLLNVAGEGGVGLLFMIPGFEDTLRVNGRGRVVEDPALLETMSVDGRTPKLAIVVEVEEAYLHCAKAFRRSRLWKAEAQVERSTLPTLGRMLRDQVELNQSADELDADIDENYRTEMY